MKFRVDASVGFHRATGFLGNQRLGRVETGKVGGAARCIVILHGQHTVGLAEKLAGFGEEISGLGRQSSIPSRRISRISGVRSS
jgi:hypothetical protein